MCHYKFYQNNWAVYFPHEGIVWMPLDCWRISETKIFKQWDRTEIFVLACEYVRKEFHSYLHFVGLAVRLFFSPYIQFGNNLKIIKNMKPWFRATSQAEMQNICRAVYWKLNYCIHLSLHFTFCDRFVCWNKTFSHRHTWSNDFESTRHSPEREIHNQLSFVLMEGWLKCPR